ncbi:pr25.3 [rat cytomegalovirus strain Maastricht]|uniref:Pr25.3 n=1 Tax=Rat cytomegalovirus (strain Maastricht) TaxID=79700 RepID=Q9DWG4_RCMVM|nr:pr25.3 [rat cytomegalovirus strain Maastricht]AAF99125.1 pr25.3 [rat cytomegalovirus strain Maastricht]
MTEAEGSPASPAVLELASSTSELTTLTDRAQAARQMIAVNRLLTLGRSAREGSLDESLEARRGEKIPLPFPTRRPTYLVFCSPGEIDRGECDVAALMSLNPSVGHLDICGFLEGWRDARRR